MQGLSVPPAHVAPCAASRRLLGTGRSCGRGERGAAAVVRRPGPAAVGLGVVRFGEGVEARASALEQKGGKWKEGPKVGGDGSAAAAIAVGIGLLCRPQGRRATRGRVEATTNGTETATSQTSTGVEEGGDATVRKPARGGGGGGGGGGPAWLQPGSDELPPWARNEGLSSPSDEPVEVPFWAWLLASSLVAIAAVGSIFEYFNKNPIFGVVPPESPFYGPILGLFAFTGFPTAGFLWFKATQAANAVAERMDREDGIYRK